MPCFKIMEWTYNVIKCNKIYFYKELKSFFLINNKEFVNTELRNESRMNILRSLYHDPVQKAVSGDIYIPVQSARGEMLNDKITLLGL